MVEVCRFNQYRYCKFGGNCRRNHVSEMCEEIECDSKECPYRHPKQCKFYSQYGRYKFEDYCFYKHLREVSKEAVMIETLKKENKDLEERIKALEEVCNKKDREIKEKKLEIRKLIIRKGK